MSSCRSKNTTFPTPTSRSSPSASSGILTRCRLKVSTRILSNALSWTANVVFRSGEFAKLIGHGSDASSLSQNEFDPKGQYAKVLDVVKQAGSQDVAIFRVQHDSTRAELYVVSLDKKGARIVGLKAVAIES